MSGVLETQGLSVSFGGVHALVDVDLEVPQGLLVGLIGPNGAGKTTFIDAISGFVGCRGKIVLGGKDISRARPHVRADMGLARTWQSIELFDDLTVEENLEVVAKPESMWSVVKEVVGRSAAATSTAMEVLTRVGLQDVADAMPSDLSQGQRKLVGVARALASEPQLVCMDEPAAGLDTAESEALGHQLRASVSDVDGDAARRPRHGARARRERLRLRPRVRQGHRARQAGRRPQRPGGHRRVPGQRQREADPGGDPGGVDVSDPILAIEDMTSGYDNAAVVRDMNLTVAPGEVVALLGANGAGKTTTLRTISGVIRPMAGDVRFAGEDMVSISPPMRARMGIAHVPEGRGIFFGLTVAEHFRLTYRGEQLEPEIAYSYFPALRELQNRRAGLLSGGEQQMLAVGRALARRPKVLLLDELSLGLAPVIVERLLPVVRKFALEDGCAVLLVEQHVNLALEVADRGYILSHGEVMAHRSAEELRGDQGLLVASYLGEQQATPDVIASD